MSEFEAAAITFILEREAPELLVDFPYLSVSQRENTGVGEYATLSYDRAPTVRYELNIATIGKRVRATAEGISHGLGFLLYIDQGILSLLEVYCNGYETFPDEITNFKFVSL